VTLLCICRQEKLNASKTPQNVNKGENRVVKRKLYSPSGVPSDDEGAFCCRRNSSVIILAVITVVDVICTTLCLGSLLYRHHQYFNVA